MFGYIYPGTYIKFWIGSLWLHSSNLSLIGRQCSVQYINLSEAWECCCTGFLRFFKMVTLVCVVALITLNKYCLSLQCMWATGHWTGEDWKRHKSDNLGQETLLKWIFHSVLIYVSNIWKYFIIAEITFVKQCTVGVQQWCIVVDRGEEGERQKSGNLGQGASIKSGQG